MKTNVDYRKYMLPHTTYEVEACEWSSRNENDSRDTTTPRALLIGDSICGGYQKGVRDRLRGICTQSSWISSLCVTAPVYLRELDELLERVPYSIITFNNGLHSLWRKDFDEWAEAYRLVVEFILAAVPDTKLMLVTSTPVAEDELTDRCRVLNGHVRRIAEDKGLPVIDLFAAMDPLDRKTHWPDGLHFTAEAASMQADIMAAAIKEQLAL
jgi:hypothetical protein